MLCCSLSRILLLSDFCSSAAVCRPPTHSSTVSTTRRSRMSLDRIEWRYANRIHCRIIINCILPYSNSLKPTMPPMPPRVESFASLSRSLDLSESVKGKSLASISSVELRTIIDVQADRRGYVTAPTPIEHMPRLSNLSENGPQLYVKRDDVS